MALSCYCGTIWKAELLGALPQAVNYHDGLLPEYKGVGATSFSIYNGEATSGFTFHRMTEGIDAGAILVQGAVAVDEHSTMGDVDRRKRQATVAALPRVFDLVAANDPGARRTARQLQLGKGLRRHDPCHARPARCGRAVQPIHAFGPDRPGDRRRVWPVTRVRTGPPGPPRSRSRRLTAGANGRPRPRSPATSGPTRPHGALTALRRPRRCYPPAHGQPAGAHHPRPLVLDPDEDAPVGDPLLRIPSLERVLDGQLVHLGRGRSPE